MKYLVYEVTYLHGILMIHFCILIVAILICLMCQLVYVVTHASQLAIEFHLLSTDTLNDLTVQQHLPLILGHCQSGFLRTVLYCYIVQHSQPYWWQLELFLLSL